MRRLAPLLLLAAAAPAATPLRPGLWRFRNVPTGASLDGHPLGDLPAPPITAEQICLTPDQATDPARWLARDIGAACTLTRKDVGGGAVSITGACPAADAGAAPGSLVITGTADPSHYRLRFSTRAPGANGVMGFDGTMTGERIGPCADPAPGR